MRLDFFLIRIIVVEISHGLIFVLVPLEFRRGTACYFFKISVEFLYGIVAYVRGDFLYRVVGVRNELLRVSYPYANNKTITLNNVNHKNKVLTIKKGAIIYYNNVAVVLSETFNKKWDGTSWTDVADISVPSEKTSMTAAYRWGNASVLQINTGLPSDTPLKSFLATDNGSEINQSGNQNFGWAGMAADSGIIVITFNFNTAFSAGQSFGLAKGSVFGFTNGKKYVLEKSYVFKFDGSGWSMREFDHATQIGFTYRYGAANLIQVSTNLSSDTPCVAFTTGDNGCNIDQSGNQYQQIG